jgi:Ca-activated chloride channel family protein
MDRPDRLPLVKAALRMLAGELDSRDRVSLVSYGTKARLVFESVPATEQERVTGAVDSLQTAGSTNMFEGVVLAYEIARRHFRTGGINRVILCSDGVANVGPTEAREILDTVKESRDWGIALTTAGFGAGSYNDEMLEKLANSGDGNYVFIDSRAEARRVFVEEMAATLQTVAKDAKIQVEFDPRRVRRYRLIGYENRDIADEDFRNDAVDAGEVGSAKSATALYEIELAPGSGRGLDLGTVYVRYRNLDTGGIEEISRRLAPSVLSRKTPEESPRLFLAACAAEAAELLRGSEHASGGSFAAVERVMRKVRDELPLDARVRELHRMASRASSLRGERTRRR